MIKRQRTVLGRLMRESLAEALGKARRIAEQSRSRKNTSGVPKLYAGHAEEVG